MKGLAVLLCVVFLLTGCTHATQSSVFDLEDVLPSAYIPPTGLSAQETVEEFFAQEYQAYTGLSYLDISPLLDMEKTSNKNMAAWLKWLARRRMLLANSRLCYVERNKRPYTITFLTESELNDQRVAYWAEQNSPNHKEKILHFTITGEPGWVYPPFMAVNAQHTMCLRKIGGNWKITFHYYPGSIKRYQNCADFPIPSEAEMMKQLKKEFSTSTGKQEKVKIPENSVSYDKAHAVEYAKKFTETPNPAFYNVGDWLGNCTNFTSQCVWYGFGKGHMPDIEQRESMTSKWYAGSGGGTPAWENVEAFWKYANEETELISQSIADLSCLEPGDILQISASGQSTAEGESYHHSLIVIDTKTMLLAQNSPANFVYYSDLAAVKTRAVRPVCLVKESEEPSQSDQEADE